MKSSRPPSSRTRRPAAKLPIGAGAGRRRLAAPLRSRSKSSWRSRPPPRSPSPPRTPKPKHRRPPRPRSFTSRRGTRPQTAGAASSRKPKPRPAPVEVADEPIVPDPTWSETEDHWRRLVAGARRDGSDDAGDDTDATPDVIVPAPTPKVIEGRWRRLVAEVALDTDAEAAAVVEPARRALESGIESIMEPASALIDLTAEPTSCRTGDVAPAASNDIERLPRVGSDMRGVLNALRGKNGKELPESAPAAAGQNVSPARSRSGHGVHRERRRTVDAAVRRRPLRRRLVGRAQRSSTPGVRKRDTSS